MGDLGKNPGSDFEISKEAVATMDVDKDKITKEDHKGKEAEENR